MRETPRDRPADAAEPTRRGPSARRTTASVKERMPRVLVVYASTHGHTRKIASRIARVLGDRGAVVAMHDVASAGELAPSDYEGVIVGASIHGGHHQREIVDWARRHGTSLNVMPSAFFSVCLTAAEDTDEARRAARDLIDDFADDTGWTPTKTASFAGALQYREYGFFTRLAMRVKMSRGRHPTDVTGDYDFTDWDAVARFAEECASMLSAAAPAGPGPYPRAG